MNNAISMGLKADWTNLQLHYKSQLFTNQYVVNLNIIPYEKKHETCSDELIISFSHQFLFVAIYYYITIDLCDILWHLNII